ncbi:MAG: N-acetylmuramoyl-L-alanine amidase [Candidatus Aminicenantes bacterium]|nr:N-acetylmuramoyl-L-alanine amidase [Candidatus Aminicenantes bacterium]
MLTVQTESPDFWYDSFRIPNPPQLIIDISSEKKTEKEQPLAEKKNIPSNTEKQGLSSNPEKKGSNNSGPFGMKTVVIDPGHGGLESGAKGKFGALEKDIALDIALKLKEIIEKNMAYRVVLTREKDTYVSLESRASVANNNRAYLFISIHANSSYRKKASGSETFFLSLNATDEEARRLAYLENNYSELEGRIASDNGDDIKMILWDLAQSSYLKQSSQLAECIQRELNALLHTANRGIKQAPFKVLTGVACPAVLVEVAFLSNPDEEKKLLTEGFQKNVARAIYRGLMNFLKFYSKE